MSEKGAGFNARYANPEFTGKKVMAGQMFTIENISPETPVLIAGPTASGKSALALQIAEQQGGVIINADAIQVFSNWRVLTARPSQEDEARAPHALYGHVGYNAEYSVGHWLREVAPFLDAGPRPIIVGGTGLNFTALTQGLAEIPPTPPEIRVEANTLVATQGFEALLEGVSEQTKDRIDTRNPMRVQRAWEVERSTGRQLSDWQDNTPPPLLPSDAAATLVFDAPKEWLNQRISQRFDQMVEGGALDEARANLPDWSHTHQSSKAIGAPELIAHLRGEIPLKAAIEQATIATRQFAKRQRTWFRARMSTWTRIDPTA